MNRDPVEAARIPDYHQVQSASPGHFMQAPGTHAMGQPRHKGARLRYESGLVLRVSAAHVKREEQQEAGGKLLCDHEVWGTHLCQLQALKKPRQLSSNY